MSVVIAVLKLFFTLVFSFCLIKMDTLSFYTAADNQPYQRNYQHENVQSPLDICKS